MLCDAIRHLQDTFRDSDEYAHGLYGNRRAPNEPRTRSRSKGVGKTVAAGVFGPTSHAKILSFVLFIFVVLDFSNLGFAGLVRVSDSVGDVYSRDHIR